MKSASCTEICTGTTWIGIDGPRCRRRKDRILGLDIRRCVTEGTCTCSGESLRRRIRNAFYIIETRGGSISRATRGNRCRPKVVRARGLDTEWRSGGSERCCSVDFTTREGRFGITTTCGSITLRRTSGSVGARAGKGRSDRVLGARVTSPCTKIRSSCTVGTVKTSTWTKRMTIEANEARRFQTRGSWISRRGDGRK